MNLPPPTKIQSQVRWDAKRRKIESITVCTWLKNARRCDIAQVFAPAHTPVATPAQDCTFA
jgi:hypothetical protein